MPSRGFGFILVARHMPTTRPGGLISDFKFEIKNPAFKQEKTDGSFSAGTIR